MSEADDDPILCMDIGATRIKGALLPRSLTMTELARQRVFTMRALGWLNDDLPNVLLRQTWDGVLGQCDFNDIYAEAVVGVPGVVEHGRFHRSDLSIPESLRALFTERINKKVTMVKDADAWLLGATQYASLSQQNFDYPALALILGTGVGLSLTADGRRFVSLELAAMPNQFDTLAEVATYGIEHAWLVHDVIGKPFFEWVAATKQQWGYARVVREYSARVAALVADLSKLLPGEGDNLRSIVIGGGNAEYVSCERLMDATGCRVQALCNRDLPIDPDLIPLLGLHRIVTRKDVQVQT